MPADLQERLEQLVAPPPRNDFRERLWERAAERDRLVARRWRAVAIAAIALATGAVSAAGVLAFGNGSGSHTVRTFDETRSCPVAVQGGIPVARLMAHATYRFFNNGQTFTLAPEAVLTDANSHELGAIVHAPRGYGFGNEQCRRATASIPLARSRLPLYAIFRPGEPGLGSTDNGAMCWVGTRVTVRLHVVVGPNDTPASGTVVMWTGKKKLRPVLYVEWAPKRVAVYMSDDCHD
jgi:hypothetical protein